MMGMIVIMRVSYDDVRIVGYDGSYNDSYDDG